MKEKKRLHTSKVYRGQFDIESNQVRSLPCYTCLICTRCLHRLCAIGFCPHNYNISIDNFTCVKSFDDFKYICKTCDTK